MMGVKRMNISDSIQSRSGQAPYAAQNQNVRADNKTSAKTTGQTASNQARLDALKAKMQSGDPVNLNALADSMLKKGAFIDVQA